MAPRFAPPPVQQTLPMELPAAAPEAQMRALFERQWARWHRCKSFEEAVLDPVTRRLLELAMRLPARKLATAKRGPKVAAAKGWVDGRTARSHFSTARVLKAAGRSP